MAKLTSEVAFDYTNILETTAQHRSKASLGEMSWGFVAGYMSADMAQTLMELNLSQRQLKILEEKIKRFEEVLDSAGA